jgi:hypothetical protein
MQGRYIGQFLPTSGGTMTGTLSLDGQMLSGVAVIADTQGNALITLDPGNSVNLLAEDGMCLDATEASGIYGDGSGNGFLYGKHFTVNASTLSLSSNPGTMTLSAPAISTASPIVSTSTVQASVLLTGNLSLSNFTANQIIHVDGTNGSDARGNGTVVNPYKTVTKGLSVATSGTLVFVGPGTYTGNFNLPSGVGLVGAGREATTIYENSGAVLALSNSAYLANLTISGATQSDSTFGVPLSLAGGTAGSLSWVLDNVSLYCPADGVLLSSPTVTGGALLFFNCQFFTGCWSILDSIGLSIDAYDCGWTYFNFTNRTSPAIAAIVCNANNSIFRAFGGNVTVNYSGTATNFTANAVVMGPGSTNTNAQFYGTSIYFNCPNIPSTALCVPFNQNGTGTSTVIVGKGTAFNGTYQNSTTNGLLMGFIPTIVVPSSTYVLGVSSSAVTPPYFMDDVQNEVAVDAGTLASNTLTINAPSPGVASDRGKLSFRVKNTNSGSTAMTLSLNAAYNVGSTTVGTIAAGKRAYLSFVYDTDNSKWDLTGFSNGL